MPSLAPHISTVPDSGIRRIYEQALLLDDAIMLVVGEPDVPVARHIGDAARRAWTEDRTNYTPNGGIAPLRRALQEKLSRENRIDAEIEQVWVTVGATQALHQAMALLLAPGDEVLVPDPGYTTFTMNAHMLGAVPVPYELAPAHGFEPDLDALEASVTDRTRVLLLNSPSNPLGSVVGAETVQRLLAFARRHDLWVISDEVYEYFTFGARHVSPASLDEDDRVFSVFSLSKTYAMTGVRVGYLVTPRGMAGTMRTVQEATVSCVAEPDQFAALAAIVGDHSAVQEARDHYRANLEVAREVLDAKGITYNDPEGAFYLWIDVAHATDGDVAAWAERFLLTERVAVAPGSAFGRAGEGWIRVCLAADPAVLREGLRRLPDPR
ncbi:MULTISPECIES: pyridoxal phosphate-dependent aminotransferase [unclassified Curtobacterium]|uniref:pyridoxal phosphate-dependent aminotransferase n=1 Tax=unclassified Curtobacterium TaxID=257496 RepID=UPI000DA7C3E3|nr:MULTISPECIES: aminotransferase class I/II-fold pyridoxal phosphate-dependent enzyme [unclassified Curtobacterium]PZE29962.1 aspartate aminotransferase [Curtobacterium sp. MCBD17_028]WIE55839.1 aminotransferase class I/II-fold pyridoxal phosphate-dependent enzyme [Curtobacterium sp. MCBD17_003]